MAVRINTNIDAFDAQRNLNLTSMDYSKAVQQLSSGLRINSSSDDAAGLSISEKLQTQVKGFDQGTRNAQDAVSMLQTSDSALNTTQTILQRMRQLAVQASNDTYTAGDRANIQTEVTQLVSEIDRISQQTNFNTKKLLDGSAGAATVSGGGPDIKGIVIQAGVAAATSYSITASVSATQSGVEAASVSGSSFFTQTSSLTITGGTGAETFTAYAGESLESFFQVVNQSGIGVTMHVDGNSAGRIEIVNNNFGLNTATGQTVNPAGLSSVVVGNTTFAPGTVLTGGPTAVTTSNATGDFSTTGLCMQFNTSAAKAGSVNSIGTFTSATASNASVTINGQLLTASGINSDQIVGSGTTAGLVITLSNPGLMTTGDTFTVAQNSALQFHVGANAGQTLGAAIDSASSQALGLSSVDVLTQTDAETAINQIDRAVQLVSQTRANIGATVNRLTDAMTNNQSAQENALSAQSQIQDVNVAQETVQFTKDQILLQAGTSVLANANQSSSSVLSLLR